VRQLVIKLVKARNILMHTQSFDYYMTI